MPGGGSNLPSGFDVALPGTANTITLDLHRSDNAGAGTLSFIVTDGCGDWETLAGGGPQAWQGGLGPQSPAPAASPAAIVVPTSGGAPGSACASFPTHAAAQAHLRADPTDPLLLDRNRNGIACEGADGAGFVNPPLDQVPVPRP